MKLRFIELRDTRRIVAWRNANAEFFPPQEPWTEDSHYRWYTGYLGSAGDFVHMVCLDDWTPVGTIGITCRGDLCEIGRVMLGDREHAPAGIMSEALQEVIRQHEADGYWLKVLSGNERAIRFYEKNGFRYCVRSGVYIYMTREPS